MRREIKKSTIGLVTLLCAFALVAAAAGKNLVLFWPNRAPGSEGKTAPEKVHLTPDGEHVISRVHPPSITRLISRAVADSLELFCS
jgi:hypothetical protein